MKSFLHRDLAESMLGWIVLRVLIPVGFIVMGTRAIIIGQFDIGGTSVSGISALLYGVAWISLGIAIIGLPPLSRLMNGEVSKSTVIRFWLGLASFFVLIVTATICLF